MTTANANDGAGTWRDAAELAQGAHTEMVEALMALVDAIAYSNESGARLNVERLREAAARKFRRSAAVHAYAVAALLSDRDEDYTRTLEAYAAEIDPGVSEDAARPPLTREAYLALLDRRIAAAQAEGASTEALQRLRGMAEGGRD